MLHFIVEDFSHENLDGRVRLLYLPSYIYVVLIL